MYSDRNPFGWSRTLLGVICNSSTKGFRTQPKEYTAIFSLIPNTLVFKAEMWTHRGHVNGGRGLIHDEDAALANKGPGQAEQLSLSNAEVLTTFGDSGIWVKIARDSLTIESNILGEWHSWKKEDGMCLAAMACCWRDVSSGSNKSPYFWQQVSENYVLTANQEILLTICKTRRPWNCWII